MPSPSIVSVLLRLCSACVPLALCFLLAWLVMSGPFSFGGGEKDIFLVLPLALWSLVFAVASLVMWARGASLPRSAKVSALIAMGVLALAFSFLLLQTWQ
jgi:hypothetical protein